MAPFHFLPFHRHAVFKFLDVSLLKLGHIGEIEHSGKANHIINVLLYQFQYDFFQHCVPNRMAETGFIVLMCGTDIVHILFLARGNSFTDHRRPALTADNHAGEQFHGLPADTGAGVQCKYTLDALKVIAVNDGFMVVRNNGPFLLGLMNQLFNLIAGSGYTPLLQNADIGGIFQNTQYHPGAPGGFSFDPEGCIYPHPQGFFVIHRCRDAGLAQPIRNISGADTL